jgi:predicted N-acetyltransferase YhbS
LSQPENSTASQPVVANVATRPPQPADLAEMAALQARVFGPGRFARSAYRVRERTPFASRYCRLAIADGRIIATLRLTPATIADRAGALLLGPLAVDPDWANQGHGRRLIAEGLEAAGQGGMRIVYLVGDMSYYGRLGFQVLPAGRVTLPGPADPARFLYRELAPGAVDEYAGLLMADIAPTHWA